MGTAHWAVLRHRLLLVAVGGGMSCPSGKVVHTLKTAKAASKRARRRTEKTITPYRCDLCGQWHVGQNGGLKKPAKTIRNNHQLRGV